MKSINGSKLAYSRDTSAHVARQISASKFSRMASFHTSQISEGMRACRHSANSSLQRLPYWMIDRVI